MNTNVVLLVVIIMSKMSKIQLVRFNIIIQFFSNLFIARKKDFLAQKKSRFSVLQLLKYCLFLWVQFDFINSAIILKRTVRFDIIRPLFSDWFVSRDKHFLMQNKIRISGFGLGTHRHEDHANTQTQQRQPTRPKPIQTVHSGQTLKNNR